jgi:hypothetical protein
MAKLDCLDQINEMFRRSVVSWMLSGTFDLSDRSRAAATQSAAANSLCCLCATRFPEIFPAFGE